MTTSKRGRKPKYTFTFTLEGVNARELYRRNKATPGDHIVDTTSESFLPTIGGPAHETETTCLSFGVRSGGKTLTPEGRQIVTFIDHVNYGCLPERTDIWCTHCHHPFDSSPIGAPIEYIPSKPSNTQSEWINDYYLTFGVFCSFPCCLAHIDEFSNKQIFRNSKPLLYSLYYKLYGMEMTCETAPSWECLKVHGGTLSIEEFRNNYCGCNYIITENIKRPFMVSVGRYIEQRKCGF